MTMVSEYDWESDTYTHNGHTNGTTEGHTTGASQYDADLDTLYSWTPPPTPPAPTCPEACFSATVKGTIDGHETMLTARGQTAAAFRANLAALTGLLDPVPSKAASTPVPSQEGAAPQCPQHGLMRKSTKGTGWYCPRKNADGTYCQGH